MRERIKELYCVMLGNTIHCGVNYPHISLYLLILENNLVRKGKKRE